MEGRDRKKYRHKGLRQTTVKTVYGEVTYHRAVYEATEEDGFKHYIYLLDETLQFGNVGLISTNMAELLVKGITQMSYRECAAKVSEMTGQAISAMGVWNVIQALGEKVCEEETELVEEHKKGHIQGKKRFRYCLRKQTVCMSGFRGKTGKKQAGKGRSESRDCL